MRMRLFVIAILLLAQSAFASTQLLSEHLEALRGEGMNALLNMNYMGAKSAFEKMIDSDPNHPAGYVYMANTIWLGHLAELRRLQTSIYNRGDSFFSKTEDAVDPQVDKAFRQRIDKAISLCESSLKTRKNDVSAIYYLGIAKNINAGYEATVKRSFIRALRNGSKGVDLHRELVKSHPDLIDAQLSVGLYQYVVGSLPFAVKVLAFIGGVRGSKKDGIAMLENVAKKGNYAKDESKILLVMLYNREKRKEDSLKVMNDLVQNYPRNSLFRLERAVSLGHLKRFEESAKEFETLLQDKDATAYIPDLIHYQYATMLGDASRWQDSYRQYTLAYGSEKATDALTTLAHLNAGKCLDVLKQRDQAIAEYQTVLKRKDVFDSRDVAKKHLKKPFVPESN